MEQIYVLCRELNGFLWGTAGVAVMLTVGIFFTVTTNFFQIRHLGKILSTTAGELFKKKEKKEGITSFQAVATALGGTIGTGNIAGVATAITAGGAGAVFWMWVSGIFGMMTKYAEIVLAVNYKDKSGGGPMQYMEKGMGSRSMGVIFAALCIGASFGIGNMTQSNSIAQAANSLCGISPQISGCIVAAGCGIIISGGGKRIAGAAQLIVPFMAIFYFTFALIFLTANFDRIDDALKLIFTSAFRGESIMGGVAGSAVKTGIARGIFTNEAGMGSSPIAHGCSNADNPVKQGMWGIFEVFLDTVVICTLTALVILSAPPELLKLYDGAELTSAAFSTVFGKWGGAVISVSVMLFATASVFGWAFYGQKALEYITPSKRILKAYKMIFIAFLYIGAVSKLTQVWEIADTLNGLMAIPNLTAIVYLSPVVVKLTKKYTI